MSSIAKQFTDKGVSEKLYVPDRGAIDITVDLSNDFDGKLFLDRDDGGKYEVIRQITADIAAAERIRDLKQGHYRFRVVYGDGEEALTGTADVTLADAPVAVQEFKNVNGETVAEIDSEGKLQLDGDLDVDGNADVAGEHTLSGEGQAALQNVANVGTAEAGVTAQEFGDGVFHKTVLTVNKALPAIAGGADLAVGSLLYTLPEGVQVIEQAHMNLSITQSEGNITADTPDCGLGTTQANGAVATLDGTAGFENIITGQAFDDCNGTEKVKTANPTAGVPLISEDGGDKGIYFNAADGWAAGGDAAAVLAGTVVIIWKTVA